MSTYTPGPWLVYSEDFESYRAIWHALDPVIARGINTTWWTVRSSDDPEGTAVFVAMTGNGAGSEVNARLIAAAPDLLAALKAMLNPDAEGDIDMAMAALRKAEGTKP